MRGDVYVGPAGWAYEDWKGVVYPRGAGKSFDPLAYLARSFDMIEVNSTFYRPPAPKAVASWARRIRDRDRFRFTVKVWQEFTHGSGAGEAEARGFAASLQPLRDENRLGGLLVQFPFWFEENGKNRDRVARIADWFRDTAPVNVEVRHRSWFTREPMTFLHDQDIGFVNIDLPASKSTPPPTDFATTDTGYVRLHGRNASAWFAKDAGRDQKYDYHYAKAEIEEWVRRVETIRGKAQVTYVVANNHFRGQAPANALEIMARIADRPVRIPEPLADEYPDLRDLGEIIAGPEATLF